MLFRDDGEYDDVIHRRRPHEEMLVQRENMLPPIY